MQNKSNINAEQMQHNAEQKYHYKHQRINVKQLTHDVAHRNRHDVAQKLVDLY